MAKQKEWPVTLSVEIEPEGLKRVVEEGRLMEFIDAFSTLAAAHIKVDIVEKLAKSGVGLAEVGGAFGISAGFDIDEPYGNKPWPWPWPRRSWVAIDTVPLPEMPAEDWLRRVVREEIQAMR